MVYLKAKSSKMYEKVLKKHTKQRVLEKHIKNAGETLRLGHGPWDFFP